MKKTIMAIITLFLIFIQCSILFLLLVYRERVITEIGLIVWIDSIILGVMMYLIHRKFVTTTKFSIISKRLLLGSTILTFASGVVAIVIELTAG